MDQWGREKSSSTCLSWAEGVLECQEAEVIGSKQTELSEGMDKPQKGEATVEERQAGLELIS